MKNKNGFTLIELLAVIVILGIIFSIATVSITNHKTNANEKERIMLRQNIIASFNNYSLKNGTFYNTKMNISDLSFNTSLSYNGKVCEDVLGTIKKVQKKDYDSSTSLEEVFCVYFSCNGDVLIDDYTSNSTYCKN